MLLLLPVSADSRANERRAIGQIHKGSASLWPVPDPLDVEPLPCNSNHRTRCPIQATPSCVHFQPPHILRFDGAGVAEQGVGDRLPALIVLRRLIVSHIPVLALRLSVLDGATLAAKPSMRRVLALRLSVLDGATLRAKHPAVLE